MVAVKLKELLEPEAKERQEKSRATKGNKVGSKVVEKLPPPIDNAALFAADQERKSAKSRDRAAAAVGISGKLVDAAEDAWLRGVRMLASCYRGRDRFYL